MFPGVAVVPVVPGHVPEMVVMTERGSFGILLIVRAEQLHWMTLCSVSALAVVEPTLVETSTKAVSDIAATPQPAH